MEGIAAWTVVLGLYFTYPFTFPDLDFLLKCRSPVLIPTYIREML